MVDAPGYAALLDDLDAEAAELDAVLLAVPEAGWSTATPAAGWDVRDTVAHLAVSEELAGLALADAPAFERELARLLADLGTTGDDLTARGRARPGPEVRAWWRAAGLRTVALLRTREPRQRVPWVAGPMSAVSFATARLMETWAHGQDVYDALGSARMPSARLRHVADLGVRTRAYAYTVRGLAVPAADVRVELAAPDGGLWTWGDSATDVVRGPAVDFCLVVTQRRNVADTALEVVGPRATEWMPIAQAFAGPPTEPRPPL